MSAMESTEDKCTEVIVMDQTSNENACGEKILLSDKVISQCSALDHETTALKHTKELPSVGACGILVTESTELADNLGKSSEKGIVNKDDKSGDEDGLSDLQDEDLKLHWDEDEDNDIPPDNWQGDEPSLGVVLTVTTNSEPVGNSQNNVNLVSLKSDMTSTSNSSVEKASDEETSAEDLEKIIECNAENISDTILDTSMERPVQMQPDQMLEIPTQELIDIDDSCLLDDTNNTTQDNDARDIDMVNESITGSIMEVNDPLDNTKMLNNTEDESIEDKLIEVAQSCTKLLGDTITIDCSDHEENETASKETRDKTHVKEMTDNLVESAQTVALNIDESAKFKKVIQGTSKLPTIPSLADSKNCTTLNINDSENNEVSLYIKLNEEICAEETTVTPSITESQSTLKEANTQSINVTCEPQPSTSKVNAAELVEDVPEVEDSLGLLAESSRTMEDDDDEEEPEVEDDEDGDVEFDLDDDSNQVSGDQSEDSNAQQSETDQPKDAIIKPVIIAEKKARSSIEVTKEFDDKTPSPSQNKEFDFEVNAANDTMEGDEKDDMAIDMIECEEMEVLSPTAAEEIDNAPSAAGKEIEQIQDGTTEEKEPEIVAQSLEQMEAVKISDSSDTDADTVKDKGPNVLKTLLGTENDLQESKQESPKKFNKLGISKPGNVVSIVDLESSSEDDIQDVEKESNTEKTDVNLPKDIEITASSNGTMSKIVTKSDEIVISGVPTAKKPSVTARLNTSELTIKTGASDSTLVIPETTVEKEIEKAKPKLGLEVFNVDSDDEDNSVPADPAPSPPKPRINKCVVGTCTNEATLIASRYILSYYSVKSKKRHVCEDCARVPLQLEKKQVNGFLDQTPLLLIEMETPSQQLVEISDSDEEDEDDDKENNQLIGEAGAKYLESCLAGIMNSTWDKLNMFERLDEMQKSLIEKLDYSEKAGEEINAMLSECQVLTDKLRKETYLTFEPKHKSLPAIVIFDTGPGSTVQCYEESEARCLQKRRSSSTDNPPAKRPANTTGEDGQKVTPEKSEDGKMDDDNTDVSVVKLCAEVAPTSLPPVGELVLPPLKIGQPVYAMRNAFGAWNKAKIMDIQPPKEANSFSMCRVKFEHKQTKSPFKVLPARCLAYMDPPEVRLTIGARVIALFKNEEDVRRDSYYSGVVAEIPNPVNKYRYLVFFDDGYAQYVHHQSTRLVCESSISVWEEVHPFSREFVRKYLLSYPERPMVRLHAGQSIKTEWNGKWWVSRVIQVDASLVQVHFELDNRTEWIYRGSTRLAPLYMELQANKGPVRRTVPRSKAKARSNLPYVEYTRSDEQNNKSAETQQAHQKQEEEIRRQRAVAKKSTATPNQAPAPLPNQSPADSVTSRVVYYTPKNAVKPYKMTPHNCGPRCKRSDVLSLKDLRTYNPLAKPLLSGWERQLVRSRGHKAVTYRAPCGRRLRNMRELHAYLTITHSDMSVDLFDYSPTTHCLAEFVLNKCLVGKKDLSHGRENVPIPCVNYYDTSLPEFCSYNTERTPTAGVPLNLDEEFLCGCDCTDDCQDKSKCACWKMTLEGARTIGMGDDVGYVYRRLPEPLPSGIYECNSRCQCRNTCLNRVVQHPLQLKLQVFKTLNRGWGIRALNDVPKGAFLCIYAGNLLTDATANLDGLNEGDEYLAELDYIEVVEQMKEGYEEDIPEADKILDKKGSKQSSEDDDDELSTSDDDTSESRTEQDDDDFKPAFEVPHSVQPRKSERRSKRKQEKAEQKAKKAEEKKESERKEKGDEDCITISDDEEVREPSRFMAQAGMDSENNFRSKYRSVRSHFGKDEACYIMDAKVQGNIGRYLNHSCSPNVFVQNVFVDTHDPRFPWVAFFALTPIRAGSELTWNYNYDVGSVPDKVLYCYCGAPNCRGRLL